jgi:hypothetical protein
VWVVFGSLFPKKNKRGCHNLIRVNIPIVIRLTRGLVGLTTQL